MQKYAFNKKKNIKFILEMSKIELNFFRNIKKMLVFVVRIIYKNDAFHKIFKILVSI